MNCINNGIKKEGESCTLNNSCIYPKYIKENLTGKLIVRPTATSNGKKALLVFGVLNYDDVENVNSKDECWIVDLTIEQILKWKSENSPTWNSSPEDILENFSHCTNKENWK